MRTKTLIFVIATCLLAACGGGGSTAVAPPPVVTPTPHAAYSVSISYTGGLAPSRSAHSVGRSPKDATTATPLPIGLVEPDASQYTPGLQFSTGGASGSNAIVTAAVVPTPTSTPVWTAAVPADNVQVQPSDSAATPAPGSFVKLISANAPSGSAIAGTLTVAVDTTAQVTSVYVVKRVTLGCDPNYAKLGTAQAESRGGVKFSAGVPAYVDDPAQADLYITGPICPGMFHSAESDITLHYPGGGTYVSEATPFNVLNASSWANTASSNTTAAMTDGATPLSGAMAIRTTDATLPSIVIIRWQSVSAGARPGSPNSPAQMTGGFKECGYTVDGSC